MRARHTAELLGACRRGEWELLEGLVSKRADVNATGDHGVSGLLMAARRGDPEACSELLRLRAAPDFHDGLDGSTALMIACRSAHENAPAVARELLRATADVHSRNKQHRTALHVAAAEGSAACVAILLERRADVNDIALSDSHLPKATGLDDRVVKEILHSGRISTEEEQHAKRASGGTSTSDAVPFVSDAAPLRKEDMAQPKAAPQDKMRFQAQAAALRGLQCRPDGCGDRPLVAAARANRASMCRILLDAHADANLVDGHSDLPLSVAARECHVEACVALLESTSLSGRHLALAEAERRQNNNVASLLRDHLGNG